MAPDANHPYGATFTIDASEVGGTPPAAVSVFRNGVAVADCTGPTAAAPDPCLASRSLVSDGSGDVAVVVRTTQFSTWSFGRRAFIVNGVTPTSRAEGAAAQAIVIRGDGFQQGATVKFSGAGISVASTVVGSPTSITASVTITGGAATGPRDVTVITNPGKVTATCTGCFSINARPTVSSATPSSRPQGASHQAVTVTGTAFQPGATATVSGTGVTVHSTSFVSATALTLDVSVDATAATGNRTISVVNPDGGTSTGTATFAVNALPTATSVSPVNVRRGATTNVSLVGSGFPSTFAVPAEPSPSARTSPSTP